MTLTELEQQYPGLFQPSGCTSSSDAEHYADEAAAKAGLRFRTASWTGPDGDRHLEYQNRLGTLKLQVAIFADHTTRISRPSWLFSFSVERVDARLTADSPHAVRSKPTSFQREAVDLVTRLRSLQVKKGRLTGRLTKWNPEQGIGLIECAPGVSVSVQASDLPSGSKIGNNDLLSFLVEGSSLCQKAVKVRRCFGR
jgi:hypothetical protein